MIRVDGMELMNSHWPRSERAMAKIAKEYLCVDPAKVLIGGLGLGFTLAEILDEFRSPHEITVAEASADVIRWYHLYFKARSVGARDDSRVRIVNQDVRAVIESEPGGFDLMLLDVDNGPEPVSGEENAAIYSIDGLRRIGKQLRPQGALLIWSAFESPRFLRDAATAGFSTRVHPLHVGHRDELHYVFALKID